MADILKKYDNNTIDIVSEKELNTGDTFIFSHTADGKPIIKAIDEIIEQRKERGTYDDESKRRFLAKVSYS